MKKIRIGNKVCLDLRCIALGIMITSPLLTYYDFPGTTVSVSTTINIFAMIFSFFCFANGRTNAQKTYINKMLAFFVWFVFITIFSCVIWNYSKINIAFFNGLSVCFAIIYISVDDYNWGLLKYYSLISKLLVILLYFQKTMKIISGSYFDLHFHLLSLRPEYLTTFKEYGMPFFTEPSHFCEFILPFIAIMLFGSIKEKNNRLWAILATVACIFTLSGNGIIACAVVWIYFFWVKMKENRRSFVNYTILAIVLSIMLYTILRRIPSFMEVINKLFINRSGGTFTKANYRIYRGFDHYFKLPFFYKITGIGYKSLTAFTEHTRITSIFDVSTLAFEYINAISQILIYFGLVGGLLFANGIREKYRHLDYAGKVIILLYIAFAISSSILFDATMLQYFILSNCLILKSEVNVMREE